MPEIELTPQERARQRNRAALRRANAMFVDQQALANKESAHKCLAVIIRRLIAARRIGKRELGYVSVARILGVELSENQARRFIEECGQAIKSGNMQALPRTLRELYDPEAIATRNP